MKVKLLLFSALLLSNSSILAQQVSPETAKRVANIFLQNNVSAAVPTGYATNTTTNIASTIKPMGKDAQFPAMYAVSQDSSWVLISADERVIPILAYSDALAGAFPEEEDMSVGMIALLDWYDFQIQYIRNNTNETTIHEGWQAYQNNSLENQEREEDIVPPLLRIGGEENIWKQSGNNETSSSSNSYNKFCPIIEGIIKSSAGCVAVAMGQLMWYWKWPNMAIIEENDGNSLIREYDWDNMPASITNSTPIYSVDMIAHLLRDAGTSVNMEYSVNGAGASAVHIPEALRTVFGFHSDNLISRDTYPIYYNWLDSLKVNLLKGYPILYSGGRQINDTLETHHQFIIDGWHSSDLFHINYGWGGRSNGYYVLDEISEQACILYPLTQQAILNIHPNYPNCTPIEISQNEILDTTFIIQNGGRVTIGNNVIENYQEGVIYSGEHITLAEGFQAKSGCNLHIAVKDIPCDNTTTMFLSPQKADNQYAEVQWCNQWNVLSHGWEGASDEPYMAITRVYQLEQDTIIDNVTYQTLYYYFSFDPNKTSSYVASLRFTEDKKVFIHYNGEEYLLYDFDVQIGDTLQVFGGITHYNSQKILPHVVTAIETTDDGRLHIILEAIATEEYSDGTIRQSKWRKRWIEGLGSLDGIVHNFATTLVGSGVSTILCAYYNEECLYITTDPYYTAFGCVYNDPIFSALNNVESSRRSIQKICRDGQLLILYNDKTYNVMGIEIK